VIDASTHVRDMAADCPDTKMVLGGYSQGAAVIGYVTAGAIPAGFTPPAGITEPVPSEVGDHVAAVALFGKPSSGFLTAIDAPPIVIGPLYAAKTIDLCNVGDPICSSEGNDNVAHALYAVNGMVSQAADFAVHHL
jgi:cutinase